MTRSSRFDAGFSRILITLVDRVLNHPTQRAEFERIELDVRIENVDRRGDIEKVTASKDEVRPGEEVELLVRMRLKEGGAALLRAHSSSASPPTRRPATSSSLVTGGDNVSADVATPVDVLDIPALYDAFYKSTELVVVVPTGRVNVDMDGTLLRNLPLSAVARLARSPERRAGQDPSRLGEDAARACPTSCLGRGHRRPCVWFADPATSSNEEESPCVVSR